MNSVIAARWNRVVKAVELAPDDYDLEERAPIKTVQAMGAAAVVGLCIWIVVLIGVWRLLIAL